MKIGERAVIEEFDIDVLPLKLIEMGCLPGNIVEVLQLAPFGDPIFLDINDCHLAIRTETARLIKVLPLKDNSHARP